jgi:hypothetical protein
MDALTVGLVIMILSGALLCVLLGYLIAVKQKRGLIAGWDESKVSNPTAYAQWVGYSVMILGICIGIIGVAWYLGFVDEIGMTVLLVIASIIPVPCLIIASQKYGKTKHES